MAEVATAPGFPDHFGFFLPLDVRRADVPFGKLNEKANEKAINDAPLAPNSLAGEDAIVPRANASHSIPSVSVTYAGDNHSTLPNGLGMRSSSECSGSHRASERRWQA